MCIHHKETTKQETWHWRDVPDNVLVASGWRHNLNRIRHTRLQHKKEGVPVEYGLDGISYDGTSYHALQAKCWTTSRKICANDIGTFLSVMLNRFKVKDEKSRAYLYTKAALEINLKEDIEHSGLVEVVPLDYPDDNSTPTLPTPTETHQTISFRDYQLDAVVALHKSKDDGFFNGWLSMPCGAGKTICYGEFARQFRKIIILSPLRVSAQQNLERLTRHLSLSRKETMLVDCDHTRDEKSVRDFWAQSSGKLISSTFKSADNLLQDIVFGPALSNDVLIIVDEAHNRTDDMTKWLTSKRGDAFLLWVSATPLPVETEPVLFHYNWKDALEAGWICDYDLLLPIIKARNTENNDDDMQVPFQLNDGQLMELKARFLVSGMLRLGVRRVISYCHSKAECDRFLDELKNVCCEEMGLADEDVWLSKITDDVNGKDRKNILQEFQTSNRKIHVIASVRILDEAIDIPACDGVFFLRVTDRRESWIRTIQRMSRANRRDPSNPQKRARIFLWLDNENHDRLPRCLEEIRNCDPEFYKKISCLDVGAYDRTDENSDLEEYEEKETIRQRAECTVECLTLAELKERKFEMCIRFRLETGKWPIYGQMVDGINIGTFWNSLRNGHTKLTDDQRKRCLEIDPSCLDMRQFNRVALSMTISEKLDACMQYFRQHKVWPPIKFKTTWNVGTFFHSVKYGIIELTGEQRNMLYNLDQNWQARRDLNAVSRKLSTEDKIEALVEYFRVHNSFPKTDYVREDGLRLGKILSSIKIEHIKLSDSQRKKLLDLDPTCLAVRTTMMEAKMTTSEKLQLCKKYFREQGTWPPPSYKTPSGYKLGNFWSRLFRDKIKLTESLREEITAIDPKCFETN